MKSNKLLITLLLISIVINVVAFFPDSENQQASHYSETADNTSAIEDDSLFSEQEAEPDEITTNNPDNSRLQAYKKKIAILAKQNKNFQQQMEIANQKQADIITALNNIVDKIDSQFLTPGASAVDYQSSSYNMDFNTIPKDVVKKCMTVTTVASASVRHQQKQSRAQRLQDEAVDSAWSSEIETEIQSILSQQQLNDSELVALNCRTTICQITVQHSSTAAKELFEVPFFSRFQPSVSQYDESIDKSTNQSIGIIYLTRSSEN
ncbi:MAG: hypothetical protein ACC657_18100 [Thiohalomonadales bacterium]